MGLFANVFVADAQSPTAWNCNITSAFGGNPWPSTTNTLWEGGDICPADTWKLVFYDEFQGSSLNTNKWATFFPYGANGSDQCSFCRTHSNDGQQIYKDNNVTVSNGTAKIIAKQENSSWYGVNKNYSSGVIHSKSNCTFNKGKFEARCKIPKGIGYWPAFWLFGFSTEVDIFEFGGHATKYPHVAVHKWLPNDVNYEFGEYTSEQVDLSLDFHVYTVEWDDFIVTYKIDNAIVKKIGRFLNSTSGIWATTCGDRPATVYTRNPAYPNSNDFVNIIFNLAIGNGNDQCSFVRSPDASTLFPQQMEIDYIRVWQRTPQAGLTDLCAVRTIQGNNDICNGAATNYTIGSLPNDTYSWTTSPNLSIVGSTSNSTVQVQPINSTVQGNAWVKCNIGSGNGVCPNLSTTKNIWLGVPIAPTFTTSQALCQEPIVHIAETANSINSTYVWTAQVDTRPAYSVTAGKDIDIDGTTYANHTFRYSLIVSNTCGSAASPTKITSSQKCKTGTNIMWRVVPTPNPNTGHFSINFENSIDEGYERPTKFELIICNLDNKEVLRSNANAGERIDIGGISDGVYIATVVLPTGERQSLKIVKINP